MAAPKRDKKKHINNPLTNEVGTIRRHAPIRVALGYPSTYRVAASSLGFQTIYRLLNEQHDVVCERFFMPVEQPVPNPLLTAESGLPVSHSACVAFSVSCETELLEVATLLNAAGLHPLAKERKDKDPPVVIGGPITLVDPQLPMGMADVVVAGDGEQAISVLRDTLSENLSKLDLLDRLSSAGHGIWVPQNCSMPPKVAHTPISQLPAYAATWSPEAELKDLFLVEVGRGCSRGCSFCVMSARAESSCGFKPVSIDKIIETIPTAAPGVGLVGAAVTDHPSIEELVSTIITRGQRVSLSSVRADRLTSSLVESLATGGLRTLTIAADGSSQRLRRSINKGIDTTHLEQAATLAANANMKRLKVYSMVGLPGEEDSDIDEFADLMLRLDNRLRISAAVQAFVPKPSTPLAKASMEDISIIKGRLERLKRRLKSRIRIMPTSPRWSWIDWKIAGSGKDASTIAYLAYLAGGGFSAWKKAIEEVLGKPNKTM